MKLDPTDAFARVQHALTLVELARYDDAKQSFDEAFAIDPSDAYTLCHFSVFMSTCRVSKYRNGNKALDFARRAIDEAGRDADWTGKAALAAALAESGDFEEAAKVQRRVVSDRELNEQDKEEQEARLKLYQDEKPYRYVPKKENK